MPGFPLAQLLVGAGNARNAFVSGRRDAQQQQQDEGLKMALQMYQMKRQSQQDDLAKALHQAQMQHLGAQTDALRMPKPRGIIGQHVDEATGKLWLVHDDGTLSEAVPGQTPPGVQPNAAPPVPTAPMGGVSDSQDMTGGEPPQQPTTPPKPTTLAQAIAAQQRPSFAKPKPPARPASMVPGTPEWADAAKQKAQIDAQFGYHPAPQPIIMPGTGADGTTPGVFGIDRKTLKATPIQGMSPVPKTTKIESAQQELTRARAQSSVSEMNNADTMMQQYEQDLRTGKKKVGPINQYIGDLANTFMHDDAISMAKQNAALAAINRIDPDFARYVRRSLSFAEGEAGISQRASDFRTRMAAFLSRAGNGASPEMLDDVSSRRNVILKTLNRIYPEAAAEGRGQPAPQGGGRGGGPGTPPAGDTPGNINLGGGSPLTDAQRARAASDPVYAKFLKDTGRMP